MADTTTVRAQRDSRTGDIVRDAVVKYGFIAVTVIAFVFFAFTHRRSRRPSRCSPC